MSIDEAKVLAVGEWRRMLLRQQHRLRTSPDLFAAVACQEPGAPGQYGRAVNPLVPVDDEVASCITVIEAGGDGVSTVSVCSDWGLIATGHWDGDIRLWSLEGKLLSRLTANSLCSVVSMKFCPGWDLLASGTVDGVIRFWNRNGDILSEYSDVSMGWIQSIEYCEEWNSLAFGADDGIVRLLDRGCTPISCWSPHHSKGATALAFCSSWGLLASGTAEGSIWLWSQSKAYHAQELKGHSRRITALSFCDRLHLMASGSSDRTVRLWTEQPSIKELDVLTFSDEVKSLEFCSEWNQLTVGLYDGSIIWYDTALHKNCNVLAEHLECVNSISYSSKLGVAVSGSDDSTARVWDHTISLVSSFDFHDAQSVTSLAALRDGTLILSGHEDGRIARHFVSELSIEELNLNSSSKSWSALVCSDETSFVVATEDGQIHFLSPEGSRPFKTMRINSRPLAIEFCPNWGAVAIVGSDRELSYWSRMRNNFDAVLLPRYPTCLSFSEDWDVVAVGFADNSLMYFNRQGFQASRPLMQTGGVIALEYCKCWDLIACGCDDASIHLWTRDGRRALPPLNKHDAGIRALAFHDFHNLLASGSDDKTIRLWNRQGKCVAVYPYLAPITSLTWISDTRLAFGSTNGRVVFLTFHGDRLKWEDELPPR